MVSMRNKKNYPSVIIRYSFNLELWTSKHSINIPHVNYSVSNIFGQNIFESFKIFLSQVNQTFITYCFLLEQCFEIMNIFRLIMKHIIEIINIFRLYLLFIYI